MRISSNLFRERGVNVILDLQDALSKTQLQVSTGKRVSVPSDDPVASTQILNFKQELELTARFQSNGDSASGRVKLEETALNTVTNELQRVRDLLIAGGNGTYGQSERDALANEIEQRLNEVVGVANTQFGGEEYLFAGSKTDVQPFVKQGDGTVAYNGDQTERQVQISASIQITVADSGYQVFQNMLNGNGQFTTIDSGNTVTPGPNLGSGVINSGGVSDTSAYVRDTYTIEFVTNAAGDLAYTVTGAASGQVVPALPAPIPANAPAFTSDSAINFNGHTVNISGTPEVGDTFTVAPSTQQDLFTTLRSAIDALRLPDGTAAQKAHMDIAIGRAITDLDQSLDHVDTVRAEIGTRLNAIDTEKSANEDFKLASTTTLASIEDIDIVEAISRLQGQQYSLDAAQKSYAQVQSLSLFNYIR